MTLLPQLSRIKPRSKAKSTTLVAKFFGRELALAVFDEFDADHQADAAHVADAMGGGP